jgi:L-ascorbate metabolism protein UlaG (beta-lactamase superfamily)
VSRTPAVKKGQELQAEIAATKVGADQAAMWWLGQASFCFKLGEAVIYFDPFYRDENESPPTMQEMPLRPQEHTGASLILVSHDHLDHLDPKTLPGAAEASPDATVLLPSVGAQHAMESGVSASRLHRMKGDDIFERDGVRVTAIPAAHQRLERDDEHGYYHLGYVIQGNGVTLYHTGDVQPYAGWFERVHFFPIDVAFLPISARDNLHYTQAVYFCALHRPQLAIPIHYGMFPGYTEDPQKFVSQLALNVPEQQAQVLKVGELYLYEREE